MSIGFRIATDLDDRIVPPAEITARQLAAFRARLAAEGDRTGETLLHCRGGDEELSDNFEARVCPFALATLARLFDYATDVITVLEEAQFRARRVKVWHTSPNGPIRMRVAETSDRALELDLPATPAMALLESLGLRADSVGEIPIETLRQRLANPAVQRRLNDAELAHYLPSLTTLIESARLDDSSRFEWA